eukprot:CCRYP_005654-RA/>CCRYP_005654-RA protein AED:0.12 eAED:0.12 QI:84/1/1/1/0.8/0.66/6/2772/1335
MAKTPTSSRQKTPSKRSHPHSAKSCTKKSKAAPKSHVVSKKQNNETDAKSTVSSSGSPDNGIECIHPPIVSNDGILCQDANSQFYYFLDMVPRTNTFSTDDPVEESETDVLWRVQVGDFVCIQVTHSNDRGVYPPGKVRKSPPFSVRWRPCQILSIFRKHDPELGRWGSLQVELRWFYRLSDLDARNRRHEQRSCDKKWIKDEIFESCHVAVLDAGLLLGQVALKRTRERDMINECLEEIVPSSMHVCYRYYLHQEQDILHLFDRDNLMSRGLECSKQLQQRKELRTKTYSYLKLAIPRDEGYQGNSKDQNILNVPPPSLFVKHSSREFYSSCFLSYPWSMMTHRSLLHRRGDFPKWQLCVGDLVAVPCEESEPPIGVDRIPGRDKWYPYCQPWSPAQVTAIYRVGAPQSDSYQDLNPRFASEVQVRIRWFYRVSEAMSATKETKKRDQLKAISVDKNRTAEEIFEGKDLSEITCDTILGPVRIDDHHMNHPRKTFYATSYEDDSPVPKFMVQNRRVCNLMFPSMRKVENTVDTLVQRGLSACDVFNNLNQMTTYRDKVLMDRKKRAEDMERFLSVIANTDPIKNGKITDGACSFTAASETEVGCSAKKVLPQKRRLHFDKSPSDSLRSGRKKSLKSEELREVHSCTPCDISEETVPDVDETEVPRVFCRKAPFHVDVSSQKSFYDEIEIQPPFDSYHHTFRSKIKSSQSGGPWIVRMGDTVILQIESQSKGVSCGQYPFDVAWSPVEIVSIYRVHSTKESCLELREIIDNNGTESTFDVICGNNGANDVRLEVRWLYRSHELPGQGKATSATESQVDQCELEEVFETDHLDFCSADSILSPLRIHKDRRPKVQLSDTVDGMPCIHFYSCRFWSIHRKSFVPSGSHSSREERGRMHSTFFGKHGTAKAALNRLYGFHAKHKVPLVDRRSLSWKEAFQSAIKTLSLAEAAEDVQLHGMELTCRENERRQISDFLKAAICGRQRQNSDDANDTNMTIKNSIFIAGPPGTGKTASVRSVIAELQQQQIIGQVPEFRFIELNGMEMRNPYDAYIKFWEAISGIKKEKLQAGEAAAALDNFFTNEDDDYGEYEDDVASKPVTVLLLDEIDYLVTDKETVLYSFFDWPLRALQSAKLIVVGISNTLNLPDRLSPKLSSRLGQKRVYFGAYNTEEIQAIIKKRLGMTGDVHDPLTDVFEIDSLRFVARKTANKSGDIRKAFHICKVAAENVYEAVTTGRRPLEEGARPLVRTDDVSKASRDMFHNTVYKAIACSTNYQALLLIAIGALMKAGRGDGKFTVQEIRTKIESISDASGERRYDARLSWSDLIYMMSRLGDVSLQY